MKILISSVHPLISSGYGQISKRLIEMFNEMPEVEIKMIAYHGAKFKTEYKGVEILPNWGKSFIGEESVLAECKLWKPDLLLTTYDIFILSPTFFQKIKAEGVKIASMLMVDSHPFQQCNIPTLHEVDYPIVVTEQAMNEIPTEIAKRATYIPLSLDAEYHIIDKNVARKRFNELIGGEAVDDTTQLTTVVSANCGDQHGRKNFYGIMDGWQKHLEQNGCKNKRLYLHTDVRGLEQAGTDIKIMMMTLKYTGEQASTVIFPNQIKYIQNTFSVSDMNNIYSASDIYLNPSYAEGFGMPIAESISCGCFPLVTDFGASKEIINKTQSIPENSLLSGSPLYVGNNAVRWYVSPEEIGNKITMIYSNDIYKATNKIFSAINCVAEYGVETNTRLWSDFINKIKED